MTIRWLKKALRNLKQAHDYIAKDEPDAAIQVILKIQAAIDRLQEFPMLGRTGRVEGTREIVIPNTPFIVIYRVKKKTVEILRVLPGSMRYPD
jgi:toxin ParE1/3/4